MHTHTSTYTKLKNPTAISKSRLKEKKNVKAVVPNVIFPKVDAIKDSHFADKKTEDKEIKSVSCYGWNEETCRLNGTT